MSSTQSITSKWMWFGPALLVVGLVGEVGLGAVLGDSQDAAAGLLWVASMTLLALGALLCVAAGISLVSARAGQSARVAATSGGAGGLTELPGSAGQAPGVAQLRSDHEGQQAAAGAPQTSQGTAQTPAARRWDRWRRFCGWAALMAAACWAVKFLLWTLLAAKYTQGQVSNSVAEQTAPAVLVVLVTFLLPTAGSILGLIAGSGVVVPWVRDRRWYLGIPAAVLSAFAVTTVISTLTNASTSLFAGASSQALHFEGSDLVAAALLSLVGLSCLVRPALPKSTRTSGGAA